VITVLLADGQRIYREGIKSILETTGDLAVAGEAGTAEEALEQASALVPDVVILDTSLSGPRDLATIRELKRRHPSGRVLVLTARADAGFAVSCLRQGADGYLVKDSTPQEVVAAIRKVHGGARYLSPRLGERIVCSLHGLIPDPPNPRAVLSKRQLEVMLLIGSGLTPTHIASKLRLSAKTVRTHRTRILSKMQMSRTAELIRYVIERDLAPWG
jgi:DNA-binding NarL/FixJ family response regulator